MCMKLSWVCEGRESNVCEGRGGSVRWTRWACAKRVKEEGGHLQWPKMKIERV